MPRALSSMDFPAPPRRQLRAYLAAFHETRMEIS